MLHQKLKDIRVAANLSQEEFASAVNMTRVAISQIELWERTIKADELKTIAHVFDIDVNELLWTRSVRKEKTISIHDKHYRIKQLILYLSSKLMSKQNFWETLLNKLLYFIDFDYYEWSWTLITNEEYVKLPYGPVPKYMKDIIDEMQAHWQIKVVSREYFGKPQKTIIPLMVADVDFLDEVDTSNRNTSEDYTPYPDLPHPKKVVHEVLEKYGSWNADALSNWSHNDMPYKATKKIGEQISPGLAFYRQQWYVVNPHNLTDDNE